MRPDSPVGLVATALGVEQSAYDGPRAGPKPSAVEQIAAIRALRDRLDEAERQLALKMRSDGQTWETIAAVFGLASRQRAQQKFRQAKRLGRPS